MSNSHLINSFKKLQTFHRGIVGLAIVGTTVLICAITAAQSPDQSDEEAMHYGTAAPEDSVTKLQKRIDSGDLSLSFDSKHGYLAAVLTALHIAPASQMLVFSKTSFQRELISPRHPRALYYNDSTYVGWVDNGPVLEVVSIDPQLGSVFYLLPQVPSSRPQFVRQTDECLECHSSSVTQGIPGNLMRSVYPDVSGMPLFEAGTYVTTDQSPLRERWGGWYVTGYHGSQRHLGNTIFRNADETTQPNTDAGANLTQLTRFIDSDRYLKGTSDIVALMVAEHQTHVQNLMTQANWGVRMALQYEVLLNKDLGRAADYRSDSTLSRIKSVSEPLVRGMLFSNESPLTATVKGTSGFAGWFMSQGLHDKLGRSLRQFDLKSRLFKYPCSYLIYSTQFDGLPDVARQYVYRRFNEILSGSDQSSEYANLSPTDRLAIQQILLDTKPEYAAWIARVKPSK